MQLLFLASAGGAIGAGLRFLINQVFAARGLISFPWATMAINIAGSFLMGIAIVAFSLRYQASTEMRTFLTTGILGGFTTFSAFSIEFAMLMERGETSSALLYVAGSVALSLAAVFAGLWFARAVLT
jgi:fluoride exporter